MGINQFSDMEPHEILTGINITPEDLANAEDMSKYNLRDDPPPRDGIDWRTTDKLGPV